MRPEAVDRAPGRGIEVARPPARVLLVGMEPEVQARLRRALSAGGFGVFEARDGAEASRLLASMAIELIVTRATQLQEGETPEGAPPHTN